VWGAERETEAIAPVVLFVYIHTYTCVYVVICSFIHWRVHICTYMHIHVCMYVTHFHVNTEPCDLQKECMYISVHVCAPDI